MKNVSQEEFCSSKEQKPPLLSPSVEKGENGGKVQQEVVSELESIFSAQRRYAKKSLLTMGMALIVPCFVYGFSAGISPQHANGFLTLLSLFAHPLAVFLGYCISWEYSTLLLISCCLQVALLCWAFFSKRFSPKGAFTFAIFLGMLDFVGAKFLQY